MQSWESSRLLVALYWLLLCCGCVFLGSECGFKLGRQATWRPRCNRGNVVKRVDGTVHLLLCSDCVLLGLCVRDSSSVVKMIGGRVRSG